MCFQFVMRIVIDTNIILGAIFKRRETISRKIIRYCLEGRLAPLIGETLFLEYEDGLSRKDLIQKSALSMQEINDLLDAFLSCCEWVKVYYRWRPNLKDEDDNHIIELAVAGKADYVITRNISDLKSGELIFSHIKIITPEDFIKEVTLWEH